MERLLRVEEAFAKGDWKKLTVEAIENFGAAEKLYNDDDVLCAVAAIADAAMVTFGTLDHRTFINPVTIKSLAAVFIAAYKRHGDDPTYRVPDEIAEEIGQYR